MKLSTLSLALGAAALAMACTDPGLGPASESAAPAPEFLIGGSPLIITLIPTTRTLNVGVEVTKGIVQAADNDKFFLRATTTFTSPNGLIADIGACIEKPTATKQDQIRGGSTVGFIMDIDIPDDPWSKLVNAANQGVTITAHVTVELIMIDGSGGEHVLDRAEAASAVDPQDGG
jgi:hypothetical protein